MTEYVILHPEGDTFVFVPAAIPQAVMTAKSNAERTVRRLALEQRQAELEREMAELDAAERIPGLDNGTSVTFTNAFSDARVPDEALRRYAGTYVGADGVARTELHHSEQKPGPGHICECGQSFYDPRAFTVHSQSCGTHRRFTAHPQFEPGAFVAGSTESHPLR